jgi:hypothetical protein
MERQQEIKRLLSLRKVTRALSEEVRTQLASHLATLSPLLRPRAVFGDHVTGAGREFVTGAEKAFKELQSVYEDVATQRPFSLAQGLTSPVDPPAGTFEIDPFEYPHTTRAAGQTKTVVVTSPLRFVVCWTGHDLHALRDLLADRNRSADDLRSFVVAHLLVHFLFRSQPGLVALLEAARYSLKTERWPEFGALPVTTLVPPVSTVRPPDELIMESTELSGTDAFEEVVRIEDVGTVRDPFRERLIQIVQAADPTLLG